MATTIIKSADSDNQALVDNTGHLLVTMGGVGTSDVNILQVGGTAITLGQKTMAASLPVVIASDQSPIPVTGTIMASNPSVGLTGATAPTSATEMGAVDQFGNLQPLLVDPSGKLLVDITGTSVVTGTVNANIEGLNSWQVSGYTVNTTAVQLTPTPLTNRSSVMVKAITNGANEMVWFNNSNAVAVGNGYPLFNGETIQLDLTPAQSMWVIGSSAGQKAYVIELGS